MAHYSRESASSRPNELLDPTHRKSRIFPKCLRSHGSSHVFHGENGKIKPTTRSTRHDPGKMHILLSNDDGYSAPGLIALASALKKLADVTVVAPERNRSGASNSLTLDRPLHAIATANGFIKVDGTPTDCVHLAITGLLEREPDMVFAGINHGSNLGDDVIYSGTVAAATEGRFLGLPAVAISLGGVNPTHFEAAAQVAVQLLQNIRRHPLPADTILNVNVPN